MMQRRYRQWTSHLLRGALNVHRDRVLRRHGSETTVHRMRNSEIAIFCASVLFAVAWLPMQGIRDPLPIWDGTVRAHPEIRVAFRIVQVAGFLTLLSVVAGGVPYLTLLVMRAVRGHQYGLLRLLTVPFLAVGTIAGYSLLASLAWTQRQGASPDSPFTLLAVVLQFGLLGVVFLAIAGSVAAISVAVARSESDAWMVRYALIPAAVATLAMVVGSLGTLVLCLLTLREAPQLGSFADAPPIMAMAGASALAIASLRCGFLARTGA